MKDVQFDFKNRNYVVVGASSGMGKQIALDLAESGAHVLAVARNKERLLEVRRAFPDLIIVRSLDVLKADADQWEDVLNDFVEQYGKFHGAVYTAGISGMTSLRLFDEELAREIVETSFWGMIGFMQQISKKKIAYKGASFVVFSSIAAHVGNQGQFAYTAAKGAVMSAVRAIAKEICRSQQRINSISPGWVETGMTREASTGNTVVHTDRILQRHLLGTGQPEDVSGAVLFLLSDAARWITGTDVVVDGGSLLGMD